MANPFFATFDLETTSKETTEAKICSIFISKINKESLKVVSTFKRYINPEVEVSPEVIKIHGLTNDFLKNYLNFKDNAPLIASFLEDCDIAGFNIIKYDIAVLQAEFDRAGIDFIVLGQRLVFDAYNIYKKDTPRTLSDAFKFYTGEEMKNAHDASYDVEATNSVILRQLEIHSDKNFDELCLISNYNKEIIDINGKFYRNEAGDVCFNFGKYKDKPVKYCDKGYISWINSLPNESFPLSSKRIMSDALGR